MKKQHIRKTVYIVLTVLTLAVVWGNSLIPKPVSSAQSWWVTDHIVQPVADAISTEKTVTTHSTVETDGETVVTQKTVTVHKTVDAGVVRKTAHILEFVAVGYLMMMLTDNRRRLPQAFLWGFLVAFLDESLQILSERGPLIQDVWTDAGGVLIGVLIGWLVLTLIGRRRSRRRSA